MNTLSSWNDIQKIQQSLLKQSKPVAATFQSLCESICTQLAYISVIIGANGAEPMNHSKWRKENVAMPVIVQYKVNPQSDVIL